LDRTFTTYKITSPTKVGNYICMAETPPANKTTLPTYQIILPAYKIPFPTYQIILPTKVGNYICLAEMTVSYIL